jgi:DNA-directed RNA polymerase subunit M/transcription elongation factor TFIIS
MRFCQKCGTIVLLSESHCRDCGKPNPTFRHNRIGRDEHGRFEGAKKNTTSEQRHDEQGTISSLGTVAEPEPNPRVGIHANNAVYSGDIKQQQRAYRGKLIAREVLIAWVIWVVIAFLFVLAGGAFKEIGLALFAIAGMAILFKIEDKYHDLKNENARLKEQVNEIAGKAIYPQRILRTDGYVPPSDE